MWKKALYFLVFAGAGYGVGALVGKSVKGSLKLGAEPVWLWSLPLVIFLVLLAHELGHVFGGKLVGFDFHLLAVGPLRIDVRPEGWKWSFNRSAGLWGGVAATAPDPNASAGLNDLPRRMLWMVAGGPLASLAGVLIGLLAAYLAGPGPLRLVAGMFAFLSGAILLATAIPQCLGQFKSDGQRILELLRGGREAERWCALSAVSALAAKQRPREWPEETMERATAFDDDSYDGVAAVWLRHSWHLDRRETDAARVWMEKALAKVECWPAAARGLIYASATYFYAIEAPDVDKARRYFELAKGQGFLAPEGKALAEAALACANGEFAKAREVAARGQRLAERQPGTAGEAMREYFALIEARAGH